LLDSYFKVFKYPESGIIKRRNANLSNLNNYYSYVCAFRLLRTSYEEEKLPTNPCFQLMSNCEQALTAYAGRRVLVYEKIAEPQVNEADKQERS